MYHYIQLYKICPYICIYIKHFFPGIVVQITKVSIIDNIYLDIVYYINYILLT